MKIMPFVLTASLLLSTNSQAQDGSLDLTFGTNGFVTTNIENGESSSTSMCIQPDGKILVAGYVSKAGNKDFALVRYNTNGSLDSTFNNDGIVTTAIGSHHDAANVMCLQPDGKILLAGYSNDAVNDDYAMVRYNSDGSLDPTFDNDGIVVANRFANSNNGIIVMCLQPDGKFLLADYYSLFRYNSNGSLDTTFGNNNGLFYTSVSYPSDIYLQPDGKFLLASEHSTPAPPPTLYYQDFVLARYNSDGSIDLAFGINGSTITNVGAHDLPGSISLQPDGKILLSGYFALIRYNSNGSLDSTFNADGIVNTPLYSTHTHDVMRLQPDGKILLVGDDISTNYNSYKLVRYNTDGSLDLTFGTNGIVNNFYHLNTNAIFSISLQSDGKILLAGTTYMGSANFALARHNGYNATIAINTIENAIPNLRIYPNPFNSMTSIEFGLVIHDAELSIYNMFGQKVKTISNISDSMIRLNREELANGFYVVCLTQNNKVLATDKITITD